MVLFVKRKLRNAIEKDDVPGLEKLLQETGLSLETPVKDKWTLLYFAARCGSQKTLDWLIAKGADINVNGFDGWTPLHTAAYHGRSRAVASLLKAGADSQIETNGGDTPARKAVTGGHRGIAALLKTHNVRPVGDPPGVRKPVEAASAEKPPPAGAWKLLSPTDIARVVADERIGYKLTDIFNFGARERIRIVCNLQTRTDTVETRSFADLPDKGQLEEAFRALKAAGGTADAACLDPLMKPAVVKLEPKTSP